MTLTLVTQPRAGRTLLHGARARAGCVCVVAFLLGLPCCGGRNPEPAEPEGPMEDIGEEAESNKATKNAAEQVAEESEEAAEQVEGEPTKPEPE